MFMQDGMARYIPLPNFPRPVVRYSIQFNSVISIAPKFSEIRAQRCIIQIEISLMSRVKA